MSYFDLILDSFCYCIITVVQQVTGYLSFEPRHDKTNKMSVRPAKTQISLGIRPVWSVFAVYMKKPWIRSYSLSAQWRLWSDWADAQADLSLLGSSSFCWFCHLYMSHLRLLVQIALNLENLFGQSILSLEIWHFGRHNQLKLFPHYRQFLPCSPFCLFRMFAKSFKTSLFPNFLQNQKWCYKIIRIFNGFEVLIENSITKVTVRHHEASRVMPNSYRVTEFSVCTEEPLWILFLAYSSFDNCN